MEIHILDQNYLEVKEIKNFFERENFSVTSSSNIDQMINLLQNKLPQFLIVSELDGVKEIQVCKKVKTLYPKLPIFMLFEKDEVFKVILSLEMGADDYITKPINPKLLLAKMNSIKRRSQIILSSYSQKKEFKKFLIYSNKWDIKLHLNSRKIYYRDKELDFTTQEFEILKHLMENSDIVRTRDDLIENVKGIVSETLDRTIDTQICKIRQKLYDNKRPYQIIKTIRNIGYMFCESNY